MKQITIGFSKACTAFPIFSWIIMLVQKTPYSHTYLKYQDDYLGQTMFYQASHTLVNYMNAETFAANETVIQEFNFQVSDATFKSIMEFAANNAGKPYGVMEILGLAWMELERMVGINANNPVTDANTTWICDQLVMALLEAEGVILPMPLNNMTPLDAFNFVKTLPKDLT